MKSLEKSLWSIFIVGLLFKIMHWPGAGILTVLSLAFVSILYFYLGVGLFNDLSINSMFKKESYSHNQRFNMLFGAVFGVILAILVIGFLFKFMLWPGGDLMLVAGLISLSISWLFYFVLSKSGKVSLAKKSFTRIIIVGIISVSLYAIQSDAIIDFYYPNDSNYAEALKEIVNNPTDSVTQDIFLKLKQDRMIMRNEMQE